MKYSKSVEKTQFPGKLKYNIALWFLSGVLFTSEKVICPRHSLSASYIFGDDVHVIFLLLPHNQPMQSSLQISSSCQSRTIIQSWLHKTTWLFGHQCVNLHRLVGYFINLVPDLMECVDWSQVGSSKSCDPYFAPGSPLTARIHERNATDFPRRLFVLAVMPS